jgi:hypothetical protein
MPTIDATPGSPLANAYVTVADATLYLMQRLDTDVWSEASAEDQAAALIWATELLDTQVAWYGRPTFPDQALALPQVGLVDRWGRALDTTVVPLQVQQATACYAVTLLRAVAPEAIAAAGTADLVIKSKKIGDTTITYQDVAGGVAARAPVSPFALTVEVRTLLQAYGVVPGGGYALLIRA